MTTALLVFETVLLAVVLLFVVGLLRSHAEILRRLAAVEHDEPEQRGVPASRIDDGPQASDIAGETLAGDSVKLRLGASGSETTLLAFLSSGCSACGPLWESLRGDVRLPADVRLVTVVKGPEQESVTRLREVAPSGREVLMSSDAWRDYSVPGSPHFVLVDGSSGRVAGRGTAASWEQIASMVTEALLDSSFADTKAARSRVRTTSERAARAAAALAASGITAGHESLYPAGDRPDS